MLFFRDFNSNSSAIFSIMKFKLLNVTVVKEGGVCCIFWLPNRKFSKSKRSKYKTIWNWILLTEYTVCKPTVKNLSQGKFSTLISLLETETEQNQQNWLSTVFFDNFNLIIPFLNYCNGSKNQLIEILLASKISRNVLFYFYLNSIYRKTGTSRKSRGPLKMENEKIKTKISNVSSVFRVKLKIEHFGATTFASYTIVNLNLHNVSLLWMW